MWSSFNKIFKKMTVCEKIEIFVLKIRLLKVDLCFFFLVTIFFFFNHECPSRSLTCLRSVYIFFPLLNFILLLSFVHSSVFLNILFINQSLSSILISNFLLLNSFIFFHIFSHISLTYIHVYCIYLFFIKYFLLFFFLF